MEVILKIDGILFGVEDLVIYFQDSLKKIPRNFVFRNRVVLVESIVDLLPEF